MRTTTFTVATGGSDRILDLTPRCAEFAAQAGGDGLLHGLDRQVRLSFLG